MQKVQVLLLDDIDEQPAKETVKFALDGVSYEIDLSEQNAVKLRDALAIYTEHARKTSTKTPRARRVNKTADVRTWAKKHGHHVNDRGRIPASIMEEYEKSTN